MTTLVVLPGLSPYEAVADLQDRLVDLRGAGEIPDTLVALSHPETITLGRMAKADAVLRPEGVEVVSIARGGEATWHGPGQLVLYPIVRLAGARKDVPRALRAIEQGVIDALASHGLEGRRDDRNTGVWLGGRKVCSVGIGLRRWVVRHGLALNVDNDLGGFARIRPCGFDAAIMTRLADHLDPCPQVEAWIDPVAEAVAAHLVDPITARVVARCEGPADVEAVLSALRGVAAREGPP